MPRVKVGRKSTAIDMTAMCDVAFLLLTFFILSAKPKVQEALPAEVPASIATFTIPETDFSTLTVAQGKVFFNVQGVDVRVEALKLMGEKNGITFTPEEQQQFAAIESFGVPIATLKGYLALSSDQKSAYQQPGIPVDTTGTNELSEWVTSSRKANLGLHGVDLQIAIKGDSKEEYPTIKKVIATLQKQGLNKFSLITTLKTL
ncbi:biopolymer transporter ExbD [Mucilaginibacter puniceus]